ncbi:MAG TPA: lysylphosphatidylglycerol synthase transmembrane domain-containing protein [Candidatus Gastranaerophilaceae bacterium]|nr:lysylphosphatidylglycerol synthase transmembrane domain-containing protein [Candidatus Gastranaerophilaceae bacterium]HPT40796.1 lysylphosphatidylglycerol synthase transmembrane domain-containing protein [Candidatus Gastranaerophilaceae bacterium]
MKKRKIFALFISLLLLGLIFYKIDWSKLLQTFKTFNLKNLWTIVPVYILTLYLRGIRWKNLLLNNPKYCAYNLGTVFTVGSMLNIYLPARAGDIYRAYYLGDKQEEKKMKIFGSIILERTLDGICVFSILFCAVLLYSKTPWMLNLSYLIGAIFVGSFIIFYLIFKFNKIDFICSKLILFCQKLPEFLSGGLEKFIQKINKHANSFVEGFEVLNSPKCVFQAFVMSFLIWFIECYVAFLIINSFNLTLGFSAALFVISLISFSTMIPSTSVFLGPYQYAYILALGLYGIDKSTALAVSTVHQGILMVILSAIGLFYLFKFNFSLKESQKLEEATRL